MMALGATAIQTVVEGLGLRAGFRFSNKPHNFDMLYSCKGDTSALSVHMVAKYQTRTNAPTPANVRHATAYAASSQEKFRGVATRNNDNTTEHIPHSSR